MIDANRRLKRTGIYAPARSIYSAGNQSDIELSLPIFRRISPLFLVLVTIDCNMNNSGKDNTSSDTGLTRYSVERDTSLPDYLKSEATIGINNCFLSRNALAEFADDWNIIRCDESYAAAVSKKEGSVKPAPSSQSDAVFLMEISKYAKTFEDKIASYRDRTSGEEVKNIVMKKFNVRATGDVRLGAYVDNLGKIFSSAWVSPSNSEVCIFNFPDNPSPQTECIRIERNVIIRYKTNSTDYQEIKSVLDQISSKDWK